MQVNVMYKKGSITSAIMDQGVESMVTNYINISHGSKLLEKFQVTGSELYDTNKYQNILWKT